MLITEMAKRDNKDLMTIDASSYVMWYVECWFRQNEEYKWLERFDFEFLSSRQSIYDVFNSVCCDAYDSFYCDVLPKR